MNDRRAPNMEQLRAAISDTCFDARQYAGETLALSTIHVTVDGCQYPFSESLPEDMQAAFTEIGSPAKDVVSVDLALTYDKGEMFFSPNEVALLLDNDFTISYGRLGETRTTPLAKYFYPNLLTPSGKNAVKQEDTPLVAETVVYELLDELGVSIPTTPQRADWDAIQDILQFSKRWSAISEQSVAIDPVRSLRVENRVDAVGMIDPTLFDDNEVYEADKDVQISEVILAIEEAPETGQRPTSALQLVQRADDIFSFPRFVGLQRVPIDYEFNHNQLPYRIPTTESQPVMPNLELLAFMRDAVAKARDSVI